MKILEHPQITRALRTGYPFPLKPVEPISLTDNVSNDEFSQILSNRLKAEEGHKHESKI